MDGKMGLGLASSSSGAWMARTDGPHVLCTGRGMCIQYQLRSTSIGGTPKVHMYCVGTPYSANLRDLLRRRRQEDGLVASRNAPLVRSADWSYLVAMPLVERSNDGSHHMRALRPSREGCQRPIHSSRAGTGASMAGCDNSTDVAWGEVDELACMMNWTNCADSRWADDICILYIRVPDVSSAENCSCWSIGQGRTPRRYSVLRTP
ncbi:hypothetical protein V8C37DRAFT_381581 [Trichoderma ceciliae]